MWAKADNFAQRNIAMEFHCTRSHTKRLDSVVSFVKNDTTPFACVCIPSKIASFNLPDNLVRELKKALLQVDVIHVHGSLAKEEKYWLIQIFCAGINEEELRGRILLATSTVLVISW